MSYATSLLRISAPTTEQSAAFAAYTSNHHSWYKHLPLTGPGEPFFFYLDPWVHTWPVKREDSGVRFRPIIRTETEHSLFPEWSVELQPGDVEPKNLQFLRVTAGNLSTAEYRERFGHWRYWNHGPPAQPRADAIAAILSSLAIDDEDGNVLRLPEEVADLGLVYLRGTVSGYLSFNEERYESLRTELGLPTVEDDCRTQLGEMQAAMERVTHALFADRAEV